MGSGPSAGHTVTLTHDGTDVKLTEDSNLSPKEVALKHRLDQEVAQLERRMDCLMDEHTSVVRVQNAKIQALEELVATLTELLQKNYEQNTTSRE